MQFIAIEVLQGNRHTYRYRLESFSCPYLKCAFFTSTMDDEIMAEK
jgi:hypothetical protein